MNRIDSEPIIKPETKEEKKKKEALFKLADKFREAARERRKYLREEGFKVVVTGKGGAGKTTTAALLARILARRGYKVLAIDEDPQINLPNALGLPKEVADKIVPLSRNVDYIEEKTGARPGEEWGVFLIVNPDVSDVIERFGVKGPDGVTILVMGTVVQAATGCLCPENALLAAVMDYLVLRKGEVVIMDTQAGLEHFGRAIAKGFKQSIVISEPTHNSMQVAAHAMRLSHELGIPYIHLVLNKVRSEKEVEKAMKLAKEFGAPEPTSVVLIPYDPTVLEYEPNVGPLLDMNPKPPIVKAVEELADIVEKYGNL
ncbi:hypothetical protein PYJP_17230 [Pyrofollis japonicus]|uniref:ATP-binding protein n=1 Tax=Pyrofollis japonicus TaxID=3060460 RepID=UPI00295BB182|nr:AAA family ATPase [Pyrofollis japonicus]BEP18371.1 hypothetical protein PYJP_17230 [Pyrofollis japonicus]